MAEHPTGFVDRWLARARVEPERAGVFLDFDGTLAPVVDDPAAAVAEPRALRVLSELSRTWGRVAVISGRPAAYLLQRLAGAGRIRMFGLYGLEQAQGGEPGVRTEPEAARWRQAVTGAADLAERRMPEGAMVERKGLTVTLHYRSVPERAEEVGSLAADLAAATGLAPHEGKMSVELRPPLAVDKGTVVRSLSEGMSAVLFAGDDRGDLPALLQLRGLRRAGMTTVGVVAGSPETPADVASAADVVVDGPAGVVELLSRLRL